MTTTARIGLLGCGTVGGGLVSLISENREAIRERYGVDLEIAKILVRDARKRRPGAAAGLVTTKPSEVFDADCDIVVELIGGIDDAARFLGAAIESRCDVVTANKALIAERGVELFGHARRQGVKVGFEASVCGGIPVIRALRTSLAGDTIESISGILNGTCNFILTLMEDGATFDEALAKAQELGFAEADPTLDIDGHDALQKLTILSEIAFGHVERSEISLRGIRGLSRGEVRAAKRQGKVIRHVASSRIVDGCLRLTAGSELLDADHPLARVRYENNAVIVQGKATGELLFHGKGAGALPTASAVLSDVLEIARAN